MSGLETRARLGDKADVRRDRGGEKLSVMSAALSSCSLSFETLRGFLMRPSASWGDRDVGI